MGKKGQKPGRKRVKLPVSKSASQAIDPKELSTVRLCVYQMKGGATKSTTAAEMAFYFGSIGFKVLLVDCDPQSNLTQRLIPEAAREPEVWDESRAIAQHEGRRTDLAAMFQEDVDTVFSSEPVYEEGSFNVEVMNLGTAKATSRAQPNYVKRAYDNVDLLPGHIDLLAMETVTSDIFVEQRGRRDLRDPTKFPQLLWKFVAEKKFPDRKKVGYDIVICDLNPGGSSLNRALIMTSHGLITPHKAEHATRQSYRSLKRLMEIWGVKSMRIRGDRFPYYIGPLSNRYVKRKPKEARKASKDGNNKRSRKVLDEEKKIDAPTRAQHTAFSTHIYDLQAFFQRHNRHDSKLVQVTIEQPDAFCVESGDNICDSLNHVGQPVLDLTPCSRMVEDSNTGEIEFRPFTFEERDKHQRMCQQYRRIFAQMLEHPVFNEIKRLNNEAAAHLDLRGQGVETFSDSGPRHSNTADLEKAQRDINLQTQIYDDAQLLAALCGRLNTAGNPHIFVSDISATRRADTTDDYASIEHFASAIEQAVRSSAASGVALNHDRHFVFPMNLYGSAGASIGHWVLIYVRVNVSQNTCRVFYFDSLQNDGGSEHIGLSSPIQVLFKIFHANLSDHFPGMNLGNMLQIHNVSSQVQDDGVSCGPWVVAAADAFVNSDDLDGLIRDRSQLELNDVDIQAFRQQLLPYVQQAPVARGVVSPPTPASNTNNDGNASDDESTDDDADYSDDADYVNKDTAELISKLKAKCASGPKRKIKDDEKQKLLTIFNALPSAHQKGWRIQYREGVKKGEMLSGFKSIFSPETKKRKKKNKDDEQTNKAARKDNDDQKGAGPGKR